MKKYTTCIIFQKADKRRKNHLFFIDHKWIKPVLTSNVAIHCKTIRKTIFCLKALTV